VHSDHLGSLRVVTTTVNAIQTRYHYDAWGSRTTVAGTSITNRGFTGHEHLPEFGLINMNARLYNPVIGRFLSLDPYVADNTYSQDFNRYTYARNNPLIYTDPNGEFFFAAVGIGVFLNALCWGAAIGAATYTASVGFSDGGFNNWNWGDFGKSVGIGSLSGVVTAGIGQVFGAVGSMGIGGEIARAYTHGFASGMISELSGGDFMQGFASGGLGSFASSAFMMYGGNFSHSIAGNYAFSGLAGGVGAAATGGNFWQGAGIGLMTAGLNHLQQGIESRRSLRYEGDMLYVDENGKTIYSTKATSGKGEHMNNPASQHLENLGPIPEGEYSYLNTNWTKLSKGQQLWRLMKGGDWGSHNVRLDIVHNIQPHRSGFYLHGGIFPGSAGCIDAGRNIGRIFQLTRLQRTTNVYVNY